MQSRKHPVCTRKMCLTLNLTVSDDNHHSSLRVWLKIEHGYEQKHVTHSLVMCLCLCNVHCPICMSKVLARVCTINCNHWSEAINQFLHIYSLTNYSKVMKMLEERATICGIVTFAPTFAPLQLLVFIPYKAIICSLSHHTIYWASFDSLPNTASIDIFIFFETRNFDRQWK